METDLLDSTNPFTPEEQEVLDMLASGKYATLAQIAKELGKSLSAVKKRLHGHKGLYASRNQIGVFGKVARSMGSPQKSINQVEALMYAMQQGWVKPPMPDR